MRKNLHTFVLIAAISLLTTGCQLLLDKRNTGNSAVVVVPLHDWEELRQSHSLAVDNETEPVKIIPIEGSQEIQFSSQTNSQLAACSAFGIIEVEHAGTMDETIIILKNEAFRLNANTLVPMQSKQGDVNTTASQKTKIEARMMKCPLKLARGN
ncbi:hypothetical protein N8524_06905 [Candidatus Puniceispirillum sp.]|nr:hypothetical protein [Candidatus Puniceispirillum sp.]